MMLTGLFVPLITPFDGEGGVDGSALEGLAHSFLDAGAGGLVALGTTSEVSALTPGERGVVLEVVAGVCRDRGHPLLVGADSPGALASLGGKNVLAALTVVPPFVRPGEAGVIAHFRALAAASPVPLVVYDVPARTGQPLSAAALRELAAIPGVVGVKHAPGGITADTVALLADPPPNFAVLGGDDAFLGPLLAMGAAGAITASAHCATDRYARLIDAWRTDAWGEGVLDDARALGNTLSRLSTALFAAPNPTVIKGVLHAEGRIPTPDVRLPLLPADPALVAAALTLR
ncbi:dihydrodipicolinate synthase family protein [Cryptosporangium sp. NPDC048952]|uniref:dihydrodipicolinate synthase family protein n=1 Tax=Cryptosporangium sp. NPDC048952 TaxID=3363961 RepID=UPI00371B88D2